MPSADCSCTARPSRSTRSWSAPARKTALVITEGFRDIYEIGRINRPDAYNLFFKKHVPLVERALRFEVNERILADGEVDKPLDEQEIEALGGTARQRSASRRSRSCFSIAIATPSMRRAPSASSRREHPEHVRLRVARAVAGISRVRALLDGRRQRLYRPARAQLYRRDRGRMRKAAASTARS